jgi:hypothetical protein
MQRRVRALAVAEQGADHGGGDAEPEEEPPVSAIALRLHFELHTLL